MLIMVIVTARVHFRIPLSVYCRATSARASPIFLRTSVTLSLVKQVTSFSRIATRCSLGRLEKTSLASPDAGSLRVFVAILRKSTAEKARVYPGRFRLASSSHSDRYRDAPSPDPGRLQRPSLQRGHTPGVRSSNLLVSLRHLRVALPGP